MRSMVCVLWYRHHHRHPSLYFNNCDQVMRKYLIRGRHVHTTQHNHTGTDTADGRQQITSVHKRERSKMKSTHGNERRRHAEKYTFPFIYVPKHTRTIIFTNWHGIIIYNCNAWKLNHQTHVCACALLLFAFRKFLLRTPSCLAVLLFLKKKKHFVQWLCKSTAVHGNLIICVKTK